MKTLALCLFLTGSLTVNAQNQKLIREAQKEAAIINKVLSLINDVSPFASVEEVKANVANYEKYSPEGIAWEVIGGANEEAVQLIRQFIENEKYTGIKIDTMLNTDKIATANENIIIHNWYTNNGGTFMIHYNFAEVKLPNGKRKFHELDFSGVIDETGLVPDGTYNSYFLIGETKGCGTCFDYTVMLFTINDEGLAPLNALESISNHIDFAFGIYFRGWDFENNYISYNEIDHAFDYAHKNDDAGNEDIFYEEGRWIYNGIIFQQEISLQLSREEFENLNGGSDNN